MLVKNTSHSQKLRVLSTVFNKMEGRKDMRKMTITTEKAINEHFDEAIKRAALSMDPEIAKEGYEKERNDFLAAFRKAGELKISAEGRHWEIIQENRMLAIRRRSGLSQAKFADKYGIPKRSIENWESGQRECPEYVLSLLDRVVSEDFG